MTIGGWIMLILSVGSAVSLFVWCIYKVMTIPEETEHLRNFNEPDPHH
jgi:hypothetical protein